MQAVPTAHVVLTHCCLPPPVTALSPQYEREGVPFDATTFPNNQLCLDLIEKHGRSILSLIDEHTLLGTVRERSAPLHSGSHLSPWRSLLTVHCASCLSAVCVRMSQGTDETLVRAMHSAFKAHAHYSTAGAATRWKASDSEFVVRHYAADILYSCSEFVTKNRDTLFDSLKSLCRRSDDAFVAQLFAPTKAPPASGAASGAKAKPKRRARRRAGSRKQGLQVQPSLRTARHWSPSRVSTTHCTHTPPTTSANGRQAVSLQPA